MRSASIPGSRADQRTAAKTDGKVPLRRRRTTLELRHPPTNNIGSAANTLEQARRALAPAIARSEDTPQGWCRMGKHRKGSSAEAPDAVSARRHLGVYFLVAVLLPPLAGLVVATLFGSSAAAWLAACAGAGVLVAIAAAVLAMQRVVI